MLIVANFNLQPHLFVELVVSHVVVAIKRLLRHQHVLPFANLEESERTSKNLTEVFVAAVLVFAVFTSRSRQVQTSARDAEEQYSFKLAKSLCWYTFMLTCD